MKQSFAEYYSPSQDEYKTLWASGTIVLDTNVLLNIYRLPASARDEFLAVLELVKEKLWVPYQVALEFQRRRLTVIAAERKITEDVLTSARDMVVDIRRKVEALQIDKRGVNAQTGPLLTNLENANNELIKALESAHAAQLDISINDPIRDRLDSILAARVGPAPKTPADLEALVVDGVSRFENRIPPGFADTDKEKNPNEATFIHNQLKYERKFGDLILWRQLISFAISKNLKSIILVTSDKKDDWWWREQGKTIGPHPELIKEIKEKAGVSLFWMYSSAQFLEHAKTYAAATVSTQSVAEVKEVADSTPTRDEAAHIYNIISRFGLKDDALDNSREHREYRRKRAELAVFEWLSRRNRRVTRTGVGFADFVVEEDDTLHGYEVIYVDNVHRLISREMLKSKLLSSYFEIKEGNFGVITIVIVTSQNEFRELSSSERIDQLRDMISRQIARYASADVVVGAILDGAFEPFLFCESKRTI